jgi:DNA-binding NarL/FixJ family response regulator
MKREGRVTVQRVGVEALRPVERRIMALIVEGWTDAEITAELSYAPGSVKNHISFVIGKLGATNRAHAAAIYARETALGSGAVAS